MSVLFCSHLKEMAPFAQVGSHDEFCLQVKGQYASCSFRAAACGQHICILHFRLTAEGLIAFVVFDSFRDYYLNTPVVVAVPCGFLRIGGEAVPYDFVGDGAADDESYAERCVFKNGFVTAFDEL